MATTVSQEDKMKALKDILDTGSKEDLEKKTSELSDAVQKVGAAAYQQGTPPTGGPTDQGAQSGQGQPADDGQKKEEKKDEKKVEEGEVVS